MAKYSCPYCSGFAHTSGGVPNPNEWLLLSAVDHDVMPEVLDSHELYRQSKKLYKCVSCSAIAVFWQGLSNDPIWYSPFSPRGA